MKKGWNGESARHSAARKGVKTIYDNRLSENETKRLYFNRDIKKIINALKEHQESYIRIHTHYKIIYDYFKLNPNYSVSKNLKEPHLFASKPILPTLKIMNTYIIKNKENGNIVIIRDLF